MIFTLKNQQKNLCSHLLKNNPQNSDKIMPVSKHRKKGQTARQWRKKRNIRHAELAYINSPKRLLEEIRDAEQPTEQQQEGE